MSGTLISDLGNGSPSTDGDLVQQIFAEMNSPSDGNPITNLPPAPSGRATSKMIQAGPNPNTTTMYSMDTMPPQAHVIGNHQPTPADFANIMGSAPHPQQPYFPQNGMQYPQHHQQQMYMMQQKSVGGGGDMKTFIAKELKTPILVAIIVFTMSLPFVNTLIAHYIPSMIRIGGDISTSGLLLKAAVAGGLFWTLQRVIVPLLM